jgi:alpha-amylase
MDLLSEVQGWLLDVFRPRPALPRMRLAPIGSVNNPLMVCEAVGSLQILEFKQTTKLQFFTWDCSHPKMSWWRHFGSEVPTLAQMGFTQIWLPPPNKAMVKVCFL